MGGGTYSSMRAEETRSVKKTHTNSIDMNFKQNRERKAHKEMKSQGIIERESRDNEHHPNSFPVIIALDLTGSMQHIPQDLIKTGLPKLISGIIQGGVESPAVLFLGVGDHECDDEPLQVGQFESGDEEMDLWLERVYLEGGGGGNEGESYGLAHYFAARHCVTDSWDKRKTKGVLITIGDEPSLKNYPSNAMGSIMDNKNIKTFTDAEILAEAQEQWEVYHINPRDDGSGRRSRWRDALGYWKQLLGQNYIGTDKIDEIPNLIMDVVLRHAPIGVTPDPVASLTEKSENSNSDFDDQDNYTNEGPKSEDVY